MLPKKKKVKTSRVRRQRGGVGADRELIEDALGEIVETASVLSEIGSHRDEPSGSCASDSSDPGGCDDD